MDQPYLDSETKNYFSVKNIVEIICIINIHCEKYLIKTKEFFMNDILPFW